jgi:hypothetical protein
MTIKHVLETYGNGPETWENLTRWHERQPETVCNKTVLSFSAPEGEENPKLRKRLRLEEYHTSRTRVCVDRVGTVDDLSDDLLACLPMLAPMRPESHLSKGQIGPTRLA